MIHFYVFRYLLFVLVLTMHSITNASVQIRFGGPTWSDDKLVKTVAKIESISEGSFPKELTITLGGKSAAANVYSSEVIAGSLEPKNINHTFLIHEIGHIVFWQNRNRILGSEQTQALEKLGNAINAGDEKIRRFERNTRNSFKKLCGAESFTYFNREVNPFPKFRNQCQVIERQFELVDKKVVETHVERKLIAPYDEFFADLMAVLVSNDPQRISRDTGDELRSFTHDTSEICDRDQFLRAIDSDPHTFFRSSRLFVWRQYQIERASKENARRVLAATIRATRIEINRRIRDPNRTEESKESVDLNFLETLREELRSAERNPINLEGIPE